MIGFRRVGRLAGALGLMFGAAGCLSVGTVQTADTLGKGHFIVSAEAGAYSLIQGGVGADGKNVCAGAAANCPLIVPDLDVSFRYGVHDRVDLGVRTGSSLIELQAKFLLTDPQAELLAMSVAPTIGGIFIGTSNTNGSFFNIGIPLLVGIKHLDGNELVFGPRINSIIVTASDAGAGSGAAYLFGVGGSLGYCLAIGEIFKILPEFAINYTVASTSPTSRYPAGMIWQLKVGFMFGRTGHKPVTPDYTPPPPPPPMPPPAGDLPPPPPPLPGPST